VYINRGPQMFAISRQTGPSALRGALRAVVLRVDYGMVTHGLAPLFVDGRPTELQSWEFPQDIRRRLTRLNQLYDRQVNWDDPSDPDWTFSDRDRNEFNALLAFVATEIQIFLGDEWNVVIESQSL
jgi:hypothetical protein